MEKSLRYAAIAGFQVLILGTVLTILGTYGDPTKVEDFRFMIFLIAYIFSFVFSIIFFWGFNVIGEKTDNFLLDITSHIYIFSSVIFHIFIFIPLKPLMFPIIYNPELSYYVFIFIGVVGIMFGTGLLKLKEEFGLAATLAGISEIVTSVGYLIITLPVWGMGSLDFLTMNLPLVVVLLSMLTHILQIILLSEAHKKYEMTNNNNNIFK